MVDATPRRTGLTAGKAVGIFQSRFGCFYPINSAIMHTENAICAGRPLSPLEADRIQKDKMARTGIRQYKEKNTCPRPVPVSSSPCVDSYVAVPRYARAVEVLVSKYAYAASLERMPGLGSRPGLGQARPPTQARPGQASQATRGQASYAWPGLGLRGEMDDS